MLIEKEVIRPGTYFYTDQKTGLPRSLSVTPDMCKYWNDTGNKMLSAGLTVPVPCEHDFEAHPMTPANTLKSNAGWVKEFRLKGDRLFSVVDITDDEIRKKLPHTIRWTSPWFNSFTDGSNREWKNVISHLALTTRPRIIEQQPFGSIAAALSMATPNTLAGGSDTAHDGFCLSRAGRIYTGKKSGRLRPRYPLAFSMWAGGIALGAEAPPSFKKKGKVAPAPEAKPGSAPGEPEELDEDLPEDEAAEDAADNDADADGIPDVLQDANGDIEMEELLCDLLQALGVPMPDESNEAEFKRHLYEAVMSKIKELTSKGMGDKDKEKMPDQNQPPGSNPHTSRPQPNPLIQQEQQPMYMSLEDINKIEDPTMKNIALSMYNENARLRSEVEASKKISDSLRDAKLNEANAKRQQRCFLLGRVSPRVKADLDAMLAMPSMALSMGDGGTVIDPMAKTLEILEKGIADIPTLLTSDRTALSVVPQPTDADAMTDAKADELAEGLARQMGYGSDRKAAS